jgi:hypothetical protein
MSSEQPYKSPDGLEPKKSNTVLIVIVVLVVLTIPALCLCGGAAFFWTVRVDSGQDEPFVEFDSVDSVPPIEAVPPIEPTLGDEPRSSDDATKE